MLPMSDELQIKLHPRVIILLYANKTTGFGIGCDTTLHIDMLTVLDVIGKLLANAAPNESLVWMLRLVRNTFSRNIKWYGHRIPGPGCCKDRFGGATANMRSAGSSGAAYASLPGSS